EASPGPNGGAVSEARIRAPRLLGANADRVRLAWLHRPRDHSLNPAHLVRKGPGLPGEQPGLTGTEGIRAAVDDHRHWIPPGIEQPDLSGAGGLWHFRPEARLAPSGRRVFAQRLVQLFADLRDLP